MSLPAFATRQLTRILTSSKSFQSTCANTGSQHRASFSVAGVSSTVSCHSCSCSAAASVYRENLFTYEYNDLSIYLPWTSSVLRLSVISSSSLSPAGGAGDVMLGLLCVCRNLNCTAWSWIPKQWYGPFLRSRPSSYTDFFCQLPCRTSL